MSFTMKVFEDLGFKTAPTLILIILYLILEGQFYFINKELNILNEVLADSIIKQNITNRNILEYVDEVEKKTPHSRSKYDLIDTSNADFSSNLKQLVYQSESKIIPGESAASMIKPSDENNKDHNFKDKNVYPTSASEKQKTPNEKAMGR